MELFRLLLGQMAAILLWQVLRRAILLVVVAVRVETARLVMKLVVTLNTAVVVVEAEAKKVTML